MRLRWLGDGTDRLTYRDCIVIIREAGHDSAVGRYALGDAHGWQASEELLAGLLDAVNGLLWQGGGGKGKKPEPIKRPTVDKPKSVEGNKDGSFGAHVFGDDFEMDAVSIEEMSAWLGMDVPV